MEFDSPKEAWPPMDDLQIQGILIPCGLCEQLKEAEGARQLPIDIPTCFKWVCLDCQLECDL